MIAEDPAQQRRHVLVLQRDDHRVRDRDVAARPDDQEHDALERQEHRERDDERRDTDARHQRAEDGADDQTGHERREQRQVPGPVEHREARGQHRAADTGREAGRQVDLAEQQHEHEAHRDRHDDRTLLEQVRDVPGGRERLGLEDHEHQGQHHQRQDGRQRPHVTAAHLADVVADRLAERGLLDRAGQQRRRRLRRGDRGRAHAEVLPFVVDASVMVTRSGASGDGRRRDRPGSHARRPARDQLDDLRARRVLGPHLRRRLAQVEDVDRVRDLEHVVHVVRDQHDRQAGVGQPAHQLQHLLGLGDPQGRRRLVEDHQLGVPQHRTRDRDRLALTAGQAGDVLADRSDGPHRQAGQDLRGAGLHGGLVEPEALLHLPAEEHVVDDVEVVAQREVLVHHLDTEVVGVGRRRDVRRLPLEEHLARIEREDPRDALDHRRLAGTVVADQGRHLTGPRDEVDTPQRVHRAEVLATSAHLERRWWGQVGCGMRCLCHRPPRGSVGSPRVVAGLCVSAAGTSGRQAGAGRSRGPAPPGHQGLEDPVSSVRRCRPRRTWPRTRRCRRSPWWCSRRR